MELFEFSALEIARKVRSREVSAVDVLEAHLKHIAEVDGAPERLAATRTWNRTKSTLLSR